MDELELLLDKHGFIKETRVNNNFEEIESLIGFPLPEDYRYYLDNYKAFNGFIGEQSVVIYPFSELVEINKSSTLNELSTYTIQIGSNGASEAMGIRFLEPNNYRVVIAQYIQDIDDYIEIGTSFTDMFNRLDKGIAWFT